MSVEQETITIPTFRRLFVITNTGRIEVESWKEALELFQTAVATGQRCEVREAWVPAPALKDRVMPGTELRWAFDPDWMDEV